MNAGLKPFVYFAAIADSPEEMLSLGERSSSNRLDLLLLFHQGKRREKTISKR